MKRSKLLMLGSALSLAFVNSGYSQTQLVDLTAGNDLPNSLAADATSVPNANLAKDSSANGSVHQPHGIVDAIVAAFYSSSVVDSPIVEPSVAETQVAHADTADATDATVSDAPAVEAPVVETATAEKPAQETPVADVAPVAETQVTEATVIEAPVARTQLVAVEDTVKVTAAADTAAAAPTAEAPAAEAPAAETPAADAPATEAPATETPTAETPAADAPAAEAAAVAVVAPTKADTSLVIPLASSGQLAGVGPQIQSILNNSVDGLQSSERDALLAFYSARGFSPYFTAEPQANAALGQAMKNVGDEGLPPSRYKFSGASADAAHAEIYAGAQFLRYSRDLERGMLEPRSLSSEFDFTPKGHDYSEMLSAYVSAGDKDAYLRNLAPKDPAYPAMKAELARLRAVMGDNVVNPIVVPEGPTMRVGEYGTRVASLRARLDQLGYSSPGSADPSSFDTPLDNAVKAFQAQASLSADGVVGPATLGVLNSGPSARLQKVLVGMERLRWASENVSGRQIYVNLANFTAQVRDDNKKVFETIVVVGLNDPLYRTPEFNDTMEYLVVNPKWNLPYSISVREYLPKIQADPTILARNNITMRIKGSGQEVLPTQIDMNQFTVDDFPFLLQQQEGDGNALGNVKFMFPNKHNIYLHDTPAKNLFAESIRTFSHGCVRVRDPEELVATLLAPQFSDPRVAYQDLIATGKETQVDLATPVPIYLTYFTAYLNDLGTISFAADSYGRDAIVADALRGKGLSI